MDGERDRQSAMGVGGKETLRDNSTQPSLPSGCPIPGAPSSVLFDSCPPGIEATRAQAFLGNQKMDKITVPPGTPPTHSPHSADTGGPPSGPRDHSLYDLVLRRVTPVLISTCASRGTKHLAGISSDGWWTGPVNDGQRDCWTHRLELRPRDCVCFIP